MPDAVHDSITVEKSSHHSSQKKSHHSPQPEKARQVKSAKKSMLVVFFDIQGFVYRKFVIQDHTGPCGILL